VIGGVASRAAHREPDLVDGTCKGDGGRCAVATVLTVQFELKVVVDNDQPFRGLTTRPVLVVQVRMRAIGVLEPVRTRPPFHLDLIGGIGKGEASSQFSFVVAARIDEMFGPVVPEIAEVRISAIMRIPERLGEFAELRGPVHVIPEDLALSKAQGRAQKKEPHDQQGALDR
jgi:hypothetical protein